jgi:energy-coupling factor transporter ATP-binding protein EcfA2
MIKITGLSFSYSTPDMAVLKRVNLDFASGEFALVTGPTGSGKSTLLKTINRLAPSFTGGTFSGSIQIGGKEIAQLQPNEVAELIGYVDQNPTSGFVTQTVREELAFGMEQLGFTREAMNQRISEVSELVGIAHILDSGLQEISGGEQQRVAIGSALTAGQKVLLLDEPTSALDSEISLEIIQLLEKISRDTGTTVILTEHRIERVLDYVDSVAIVHADGSVTKGASKQQFLDYRIEPPIVALSKKLGWSPIEVKLDEAKSKWVTDRDRIKVLTRTPRDQSRQQMLNVATVENLSVRFGDNAVISNLEFTIDSGEVVALMGKNGSGKTTTLWAIQGSLTNAFISGEVKIRDTNPAKLSAAERLDLVAMVPQNSSDLLFLNSLGKELVESDAISESVSGSTAKIFEKIAGRIDPATHPRDLSTGQQLALVLASQLVKDAPLVLLDEPTRGLDYEAKRQLADTLDSLRAKGKAILIACHDVEFIAEICDRVVILNQGIVDQSGTPEEVFTPNSPYATQISQITQMPGVITLGQIELANSEAENDS